MGDMTVSSLIDGQKPSLVTEDLLEIPPSN
jgi:hypothetical protein